MLQKDEKQFIEKYILKSGEELDSSTNITDNLSFTDIKIVKKTERTFRIVGLLTISKNDNNIETVDEELLKSRLTPKKKIDLNDYDPNTIYWFEQGWIMKEIRFKKDGRTPESQHYRMGYRLYRYILDLQREKEQELELEFNDINRKFRSIQMAPTFQISKLRENGVLSCITVMNEIFEEEAPQLHDSVHFPAHWSFMKKMKFIHFLAAFLQIGQQKLEFDWKEIGAGYYKEIGGSKEFDPYKEEFIDHLENLSQCPAALLGLTSLGKITPLYFSGQLSGQYSSYSFGPVHALTDFSISQEEYSTNATTMWLVENRAILTRIASEKGFLQEMNSLMLCIDGHLRSSHKQAIIQILKNSKIEQVIFWTDYDPDGLQISKELYGTVSETKTEPRLKWITAEQGVLVSWLEYQEYMQAFLKIKQMEQEEILGGADNWKKWVRH